MAKLLPTHMAARQLGISPKWLRAEAEAGRLPALFDGRKYIFDRDALEAALLKRARAGDPGAALAGERDK